MSEINLGFTANECSSGEIFHKVPTSCSCGEQNVQNKVLFSVQNNVFCVL